MAKKWKIKLTIEVSGNPLFLHNLRMCGLLTFINYVIRAISIYT